MALTVFIGPPGAGKSTEIIKLLRRAQRNGDRVALYLPDHEFLNCRPNVKPGGYMGCRTGGLSFPITKVVGVAELETILGAAQPRDLVVIDEVQYLGPSICPALIRAHHNDVNVVVGMPSQHQLIDLEKGGCTVVKPNHAQDVSEFDKLLETSPPFPGERRAYQPLFGLDLDFSYVREDCPQRLKIMLSACRIKMGFSSEVPAGKTYLDVGCCSGYFVEGMASAGFKSTGVDVQKVFFDIGRKLSTYRDSGTEYILENASDFSRREEKYDVISTFATIQWVMVQQGYEAGRQALINLMNRANDVFVLEMGYSSEDVYKGKIDVEIDREWTLSILKNEGAFGAVRGYWAGENGLWRDVFVAMR
ncbi:MAG: methyltransferase domain-containing protein [Rhodospirillaceae bacterium]